MPALKKPAGLLLLGFVLAALRALTPLGLVAWEPVAGNGSRAALINPDEAVFIIRRDNSGPKSDERTHGYAYLLSPPVYLPPNWRHIEISGEWWREKTSRSNYPELELRVFSHYPALPHGNSSGGVRESNFIHIGYRSWRPSVYYLDKGEGAGRSGSLRTSFPDAPRGFMLSIFRMPDGKVMWIFHELRRGGDWRRLFGVARSRLFDGADARRLFIRIGGWNTWERPIANRLHVRDLHVRVSTWQSADDMPGNFELNDLDWLKTLARREGTARHEPEEDDQAGSGESP